MKDWKPELRANFASITLGKQLYEAACTVYAPAALAIKFSALPAQKRDEYIAVASFLLASVKPPDGLAQLARQTLHVVRS